MSEGRMKERREGAVLCVILQAWYTVCSGI